MQRLLTLFLIGPALVSMLLLSACGPRTDGKSFTEHVKAAAAEEAYTGPALWRVADDDTTVYLFGTVHTLREGVRWQSDTITETLLSADAVYFEADTQSTNARGEINAAVTRFGLMTDGDTLEDLLPEDAEREVEETAALLDVPLYSLSNFKPWLASFALSDIHQEKLGFDQALGVEKVLANLATDRAIPLRYLETGVYQLQLIASVPDAEQIALLVQTAEQIESDPDFLDRTIEDWSVGDVSALAQTFKNSGVFGQGEIYNLMVRTRNVNWSQKITSLMENEAGTFFIAVGAAHLTGDDSLQTILASLGVEAERVNPPKASP